MNTNLRKISCYTTNQEKQDFLEMESKCSSIWMEISNNEDEA